jgi:hypothetical protein
MRSSKTQIKQLVEEVVIEDWTEKNNLLIPVDELFELAQFIVSKHQNDTFTSYKLANEEEARKIINILPSQSISRASVVLASKLKMLYDYGILRKRFIEEKREKYYVTAVNQYTPSQKGIEAIKEGFIAPSNPESESTTSSKEYEEVVKKTKDVVDSLPSKPEPVTPQKDYSFFDGSSVKFERLIKSSDPEIRKWAKDLYQKRETMEGPEYITFVKDLREEAIAYHNISCERRPIASCISNCDVWKLLHLCLYIIGKKN